jgi:hypothetical protein
MVRPRTGPVGFGGSGGASAAAAAAIAALRHAFVVEPDGIIPPGAKVSTGNPVIKEKLDPLDHSRVTEYRTRMTWGREKEPGDHPTSSSTIDTTAMKLLLNSTT